MEGPIYTDPATGRKYTVTAEGRSIWLDEPPSPSRTGSSSQPAVAASAAQHRKKGHRGLVIAGSVVGVLLLMGVIGAIASPGSKDANTGSSAGSATETAEAAPSVTTPPPGTPAPQYTPTAKDFSLKVHILSKKCFGSAGCNVTFRIDPAYAGEPISDDETFTVVYRVTGGEDPLENSFTLTGSEASFEGEEFVSTPTSRVRLKAVVTEVLPS